MLVKRLLITPETRSQRFQSWRKRQSKGGDIDAAAKPSLIHVSFMQQLRQ
jgi:hypothetical protein